MTMAGPPSTPARPPARPGPLTAEEYAEGVRRGDRSILGRAITLIESASPQHEAKAQEVLQRILPHTGASKRVGITGVPGVGKSTFIEALGMFLCAQGHRVAVLAVDPTSTFSKGSILGDKTRMERLSGQPNAFIRPSPSGASSGGVARRTRETLLLCEAAGFDVVLVETVGVGQNEVTLRSLVDFFLLLLLPGAGDDLQGIKRGIVEMADMMLINKADGENLPRARAALADQSAALHFLPSPTPPWRVRAALASGRTGEGIPECWAIVERFYAELEPGGLIAARRRNQLLQWLEDMLREELVARLHRHPGVQSRRPILEQAMVNGQVTIVRAARALLDVFNPPGPAPSPAPAVTSAPAPASEPGPSSPPAPHPFPTPRL